MKECEDLNSSEMTVLVVCCDACNHSTNRHVSIEAITKRIQIRKPKKFLRTLLSNGFVLRHPTRGSMTYTITRIGLDCVDSHSNESS